MDSTEPNPPESLPAPAAPQRQEKILMTLLLAFCFLTSAGIWLTGLRHPASPEATAEEPEKTSLTDSLLQEHADLGIIAVDGTIMHQAEGGLGSSGGASAEKLVQAIRQAEKDGVKGLLIKINSPGGTAAASQAVYQQIQAVKRRSKMHVIASMGDMAASGGYYIACAADQIVANPATLTGSIGVIAQFTKLQGLYEKVGLSATVIKSGKHKDIGSPFRPTTAEETRILQAMIDDTYRDFVKAVAQGRKLPEPVVRQLADGRIYTGNQALANKLVDQLGDYQFALDQLKKMTRVGPRARVKNYSKASLHEWLEMLSTRFQISPLETLGQQLDPTHLRQLNKVPLMLYE